MVLVAEDDADIAEAVVEVLQVEGYECDWASDGLTACRRLEQESGGRYGLVLLDMRMPLMCGPEVLTVMRECRIQVPVIAVTAQAHRFCGLVEEEFQVPCLHKPFDIVDLVRAVRMAYRNPHAFVAPIQEPPRLQL